MGSAPQVARHIGTDAHIQFWWRSKSEVGIETDDGVNLAYGYFQALGHPVQLLGRKVPKLPLDGSELIEHRDLPQACRNRQGVPTDPHLHGGRDLGPALPWRR